MIADHIFLKYGAQGLVRAQKALLERDPDVAAGCEHTAKALREHIRSFGYNMRAGSATEQPFTDDLVSILHAAMERHCWSVVADVASELRVWPAGLKETCSADLTAQLAAFKERYS